MTSSDQVVAHKQAKRLLALVISASALPFLPAVASAATGAGSTGTLSFLPASGSGAVPLTAVSTGVCSDPRGTNVQLAVSGAGFPPDTNVTPNLAAHVYAVDPSMGGYDVPLQDTLEHFAARQSPPAILSGRYDFTLVCKKPWGVGVYDTYTGSLWFSSPTSYHSLTLDAGAAATTGAAPVHTAATTPHAPAAVTARVSKRAASPTLAPVTTSPVQSRPTGGATALRSPVHVSATHASAAPPRHPAAAHEPAVSPAGRPATAASLTPAPSSAPPRPRTSAGRSPAARVPAVSPSTSETSAQPAVATAPAHGPSSVDARLAGLVGGSVAALAALGLIARRRMSRYGRR